MDIEMGAILALILQVLRDRSIVGEDDAAIVPRAAELFGKSARHVAQAAYLNERGGFACYVENFH
jgi:hypothetical protein